MKKQLIFIILSFLCLAAQSVKADFRKADMDGWNIKTNSALEAGPAGKHGFLRDNRKGGVEFEHLPGVPQRFNGFNTMLLHFNSTLKKEKISELSQRIRRSGYNCIRLNIPYNSDFKNARGEVFLAPEKLDFMDYYIAEMKRNGIYIQFILGIGSFGKETNKYAWINISNLKLRMFLGDPEVRNFYRELNTLLLNHINPYTGIAYKDDPVFLSMECYNEQELGIERWQSAPRVSKPSGKQELSAESRKPRMPHLRHSAWSWKRKRFSGSGKFCATSAGRDLSLSTTIPSGLRNLPFVSGKAICSRSTPISVIRAETGATAQAISFSTVPSGPERSTCVTWLVRVSTVVLF